MHWSDVVDLVSVSHSDATTVVVTENTRTVYANKKSVVRSEYYQAIANGLNPTVTFEVHSFEYEDEQKLRFEGKDFLILRTFSDSDETIELVCQAFDDVQTNLARLRNEIEVWHRVSALNELSETIQRDELFAKLPAEIVPEAGSVTGQPADTTVVNVTHKIIIKYRDGITPDMFIRFGVQRFDIRYILNPFSRNETLEIHVEELIE